MCTVTADEKGVKEGMKERQNEEGWRDEREGEVFGGEVWQ